MQHIAKSLLAVVILILPVVAQAQQNAWVGAYRVQSAPSPSNEASCPEGMQGTAVVKRGRDGYRLTVRQTNGIKTVFKRCTSDTPGQMFCSTRYAHPADPDFVVVIDIEMEPAQFFDGFQGYATQYDELADGSARSAIACQYYIDATRRSP